jgi:hypothetical protein
MMMRRVRALRAQIRAVVVDAARGPSYAAQITSTEFRACRPALGSVLACPNTRRNPS